MKKTINVTSAVILLLSIAVVTMAFGFANYAQDLNIGQANVTVAAAKWDVHFKTDSYQETTNSVVATSPNITATTFSFDATLAKPGDFYEAKVTVENGGTFAAALNSINMSTTGVDAGNKFLSYSITYDGTTYTTTTTGLNKALAVGATKDVIIRVEYLTPTNASDLPSSAVTAKISGTLNYVQA